MIAARQKLQTAWRFLAFGAARQRLQRLLRWRRKENREADIREIANSLVTQAFDPIHYYWILAHLPDALPPIMRIGTRLPEQPRSLRALIHIDGTLYHLKIMGCCQSRTLHPSTGSGCSVCWIDPRNVEKIRHTVKNYGVKDRTQRKP